MTVTVGGWILDRNDSESGRWISFDYVISTLKQQHNWFEAAASAIHIDSVS